MWRLNSTRSLIAMASFVVPTVVLGASVKGIMKNRYVAVDEGRYDGFTKRQKVCFFNGADEKVACGRVVKSSSSKAFVGVRRKKLKRIKPGMTARLIHSSNDRFESSNSGTKTVNPGSAIGARNIKFGYLMSPLMPANYNLLSYGSPGQSLNVAAAAPASTWVVQQNNQTSLIGGGGEFSLGISQFKLAAGGRWKYSPEEAVDSLYGSSGSSAQTLTKFQAFGGHVDFYYLVFRFGSHSLDIGNGVDFDYSQVRVSMMEVSQSGEQNPRHSIGSDLGVASIRSNVRFNLYFNPIGVQVGSTLLVPVYASQISSFAEHNDGAVNEATYFADAQSALAHQKSSFGLDLFAGMFYGF